jgi:hypothetical protein
LVEAGFFALVALATMGVDAEAGAGDADIGREVGGRGRWSAEMVVVGVRGSKSLARYGSPLLWIWFVECLRV